MHQLESGFGRNGDGKESTSIHAMLQDPQEWLKVYREEWASCFPERSSQRIVIGCGDPRVADGRGLAYPGLGGFHVDLETAAGHIISLRERVLCDCEIVLQTHDDCGAMKRALADRDCDPQRADEFARLWGKCLRELIISRTGDPQIVHEHLRYSRMRKARDIEAVYVDCTDRFQASEAVAHGPTVSLLNPGGIPFRTRAAVFQIFGNGLAHHLSPQLEFMVRLAFDSRMAPNGFSHQHPLTVVVIRNSRELYLSDVTQGLAEESAKWYAGSVKVLPVDERGRIYELHADKKGSVGCP